jgi:hypothetical protein
MRINYTYRLTGKNYIIRIEDGMMMNIDHPIFLNWLQDGNIPLPPIEELISAIENKHKAQELLIETDWVEFASVSNPAQPKYLTNLDEFIVYRNALRQIMLAPQEGSLIWPEKPIVKWS